MYSPHQADGRGHTSLSEAAAQGHEDIIHLLLKEGANPNALNDVGRSGLWRACYNGHLNVVLILLEAGADPSFRDQVQDNIRPLLIEVLSPKGTFTQG